MMKKLIYLPILLLLLFNGMFFLLKNAQAIAGREQRNDALAVDFIKKHIPEGSKVIGEPLYFYAVLQNGSDFQYLNLYEDLEDRERFHREVYDYDYLLVTDHLKMRDTKGCIDYYLKQADFKSIASLKIPEPPLATWFSNFNIGGFPLISHVERYGYNCEIYQRIKPFQ